MNQSRVSNTSFCSQSHTCMGRLHSSCLETASLRTPLSIWDCYLDAAGQSISPLIREIVCVCVCVCVWSCVSNPTESLAKRTGPLRAAKLSHLRRSTPNASATRSLPSPSSRRKLKTRWVFIIYVTSWGRCMYILQHWSGHDSKNVVFVCVVLCFFKQSVQ